jgi:hypothetical protein
VEMSIQSVTLRARAFMVASIADSCRLLASAFAVQRPYLSLFRLPFGAPSEGPPCISQVHGVDSRNWSSSHPLHVAEHRLAAFVDVGLARVPDVGGASLGLPASGWQPSGCYA